MSRQPDKPGTYRIKPSIQGGWRLSGVDASGKRVRQHFSHEHEAQTMADVVFGKKVYDDWGVPVSDMRPSAETLAGLNANLGIGAPSSTPLPVVPPVDAAKKKADTKFAHSMAEIAGLGWASGTVMLGRRLTENINREPVKPNPKQVNDLADSAKETITGWFGDREIKPWQMMMLLTLVIPASMMLQSPPKKVEPKTNEAPPSNLKSVP